MANIQQKGDRPKVGCRFCIVDIMIFKSFEKTIREKGGSISAGIKEKSGIIQLNNDISGIEKSLAKEYEALGRIYYEYVNGFCDGSPNQEEEMNARIGSITEMRNLIEDKKEEKCRIEQESADRKAQAAERKAQEAERKAMEREHREKGCAEREQVLAVENENTGQMTESDQLITCRKCGSSMSLEYKFCPICGSDQDFMLCPSCGKIIEKGRFCVFCGTRLDQEEATEEIKEKLIGTISEETVNEMDEETGLVSNRNRDEVIEEFTQAYSTSGFDNAADEQNEDATAANNDNNE